MKEFNCSLSSLISLQTVEINFPGQFVVVPLLKSQYIYLDSKFLPDGFFFAELVLSGLWVVGAEQPTPYTQLLQLRDPKNDLIFNFNFDDKMKNL